MLRRRGCHGHGPTEPTTRLRRRRSVEAMRTSKRNKIREIRQALVEAGFVRSINRRRRLDRRAARPGRSCRVTISAPAFGRRSSHGCWRHRNFRDQYERYLLTYINEKAQGAYGHNTVQRLTSFFTWNGLVALRIRQWPVSLPPAIRLNQTTHTICLFDIGVSSSSITTHSAMNRAQSSKILSDDQCRDAPRSAPHRRSAMKARQVAKIGEVRQALGRSRLHLGFSPTGGHSRTLRIPPGRFKAQTQSLWTSGNDHQTHSEAQFLPREIERIIQEYVREKCAGAYGHGEARLRHFRAQLDDANRARADQR